MIPPIWKCGSCGNVQGIPASLLKWEEARWEAALAAMPMAAQFTTFPDLIAQRAFTIADAMLAESMKPRPEAKPEE